MKKRLRILALYRTAELKKNIAGILDNENAFYTTYAFLDSGDICQLSAEKDPDIILLEASDSVLLKTGQLSSRQARRLLHPDIFLPSRSLFYTRSSVRHGVGTLRRKF